MYEPFQKLECIVIKQGDEKHLYEVLIKGDNVKATLVCVEPLTEGEEIVGLFGAFKDGHYLLTADGAEIQTRRRKRKNSESQSRTMEATDPDTI